MSMLVLVVLGLIKVILLLVVKLGWYWWRRTHWALGLVSLRWKCAMLLLRRECGLKLHWSLTKRALLTIWLMAWNVLHRGKSLGITPLLLVVWWNWLPVLASRRGMREHHWADTIDIWIFGVQIVGSWRRRCIVLVHARIVIKRRVWLLDIIIVRIVVRTVRVCNRVWVIVLNGHFRNRLIGVECRVVICRSSVLKDLAWSNRNYIRELFAVELLSKICKNPYQDNTAFENGHRGILDYHILSRI